MESHLILVMLSVVAMVLEISLMTHAAVPMSIMKHIDRVNKNGPYLGIVVPNAFEMNPLLQSPSFVVDHNLPYLDFSGRRFRFGCIRDKNVILVMTGLSMGLKLEGCLNSTNCLPRAPVAVRVQRGFQPSRRSWLFLIVLVLVLHLCSSLVPILAC